MTFSLFCGLPGAGCGGMGVLRPFAAAAWRPRSTTVASPLAVPVSAAAWPRAVALGGSLALPRCGGAGVPAASAAAFSALTWTSSRTSCRAGRGEGVSGDEGGQHPRCARAGGAGDVEVAGAEADSHGDRGAVPLRWDGIPVPAVEDQRLGGHDAAHRQQRRERVADPPQRLS